MKRKIPILITAVAIFIACAVPAFAAEIDYNDYITNENVSGDDTIVDVSIPIDVFHSIQWRLWNRTNGTWPLLVEAYGKSFTHSYSQSLDYALTVAPFGTDVLDVRDIPDGTVLTFSYTVHGAAYSGESGLPARIGMSYYDANGKSLGFVNGAFQTGQFLEDNAVSFTLDKPDGCVSVKPALTFDSFNPIGNQTYTFTLESVSFRFSVDSLLKLQQETGRTNKLLEQIMNGYDPDPEIPPVNDDVDDMHQAEDEVIEQFQPDRVYDDLDDMTVTILDNLVLLANAFGLITLMFDALLGIPELGLLAYISLCLGLLAALLGIGVAVISSKGDK